MKARNNKLYVDINTGEVFHKPVKINGVDFEIKPKFYEITESQAARLLDGEPLGEVIREGVEAKIMAEVEKTVKKKIPAALDIEAEDDINIDPEILRAIMSKDDILKFAKDSGVTLPKDVKSFSEIKKYLKSL
jgi:hypothetical protein